MVPVLKELKVSSENMMLVHIYRATDLVIYGSHSVSRFVIPTTLWGRHDCYSHFMGDETEALGVK